MKLRLKLEALTILDAGNSDLYLVPEQIEALTRHGWIDRRRRGGEGCLRVGSDEGAEEEGGGEPVLGDLVVDLGGDVLPQPRHHLLLERR